MAELRHPDLPSEFQQLLEWIGQGVDHMDHIPDERTREEVFALLEGIDLLHRRGLARLLEQVETLGGDGLLERVVRDPVVASLLELYGLPDEDERPQVERVLETVRPYIESHGGHLDLLSVEDGQVTVRLSGSCQGCPGSAVTLRRVVEEALRSGFPGFRALIDDTLPPPQPVRIQFQPTVLRRPRWVTVAPVSTLPRGEMVGVWPEGNPVLLVRLGDEVYAHQNGCPPGSALVLHTGQLDGFTITCPWHGCRYDIRTGKRLDREGKLGVLPVAIQNGEVRVALGVEEVTVG